MPQFTDADIAARILALSDDTGLPVAIVLRLAETAAAEAATSSALDALTPVHDPLGLRAARAVRAANLRGRL